MTHIAHYISSHGFGHAARQQALIDALAAAGHPVHVRTAAPQKFFASAATYHQKRFDIGLVQRDALTLDIEASLAWYADFIAQDEAAFIEQEVAFLHANEVKLVLADMPPIAFAIAAEAGVVSVAVTSFTWDWIYGHYLAEYPAYRPVVEHVHEQYQRATLALRLPMAHEFPMFPQVEDVPLLVPALTQTRDEVRASFDIPADVRLGLLSMGGHSWGKTRIQTLREQADWVFLVTPGAYEQVRETPERFRVVPMEYPNYHNLIAHADLVVGKAGGSTCAQVIAYQTPMIYTTVPQQPEGDLLRAGMENHATAQFLPTDAFVAGQWVEIIDAVASMERVTPGISADGASVITARLAPFLAR